ncbi:transcription factor 21-like isoform X2 [Limulus polyphemus]|uniref:Transcription factor 21-like isoform X2 n=1 Tax=Limulus polyphemus TaxID=6850 RepID=A0ABM1TND4_LIMPO|nr:transcription factor 21-like isoform X2 [Limulus polyphemus]
MAKDRKGFVGNMGISKKNKPIQRNAANARERARMRVLSKAFSKLKTSLPWVPEDTKLSKLDTLRLASSYIAHLRQILTEDTGPHAVVHPITLTWPFSFNSRTPPSSQETCIPKITASYDVPFDCRQIASDCTDMNLTNCNYNNNVFNEMQFAYGRSDSTMSFN